MASLEKRVRNGKTTWSIRYRVGTASRRKVFRTKALAEKWLHDNESSGGQLAVREKAGKVTVGAQAERWLASKGDKAPTTQRDYRMLLDHQVLPAFRTTSLAAIDKLAVETWLADLARAGLSPKRRREAHGVLRQVLGSAGFTVEVKPPKVQRREMVCLTAEQVEALAVAITPPYGTLVRAWAWLGFRPSEVTALRLRHFDQLHGTVRVAEAAPLLDGKLVFGPTKTYAARTIHLPGFLREELKGHVDARGLGPNDFLFTMPRGGPLRENRFVADHLKPAAVQAGLCVRTVRRGGREVVTSDLRAYDLRHTAASLAIHEGANVLTVSKMLGHERPSTTMNIYGHLFGSELEALARHLDKAHERAVEVRPPGGPGVTAIGERAGQQA